MCVREINVVLVVATGYAAETSGGVYREEELAGSLLSDLSVLSSQ